MAGSVKRRVIEAIQRKIGGSFNYVIDLFTMFIANRILSNELIYDSFSLREYAIKFI